MLSIGPSSASVDAGANGGSAGGATVDTPSGVGGAAGASNIRPWNAGGQGAGQQQPCDIPAACECDSQAPECQPAIMSACLGQHCPPSLDDAMLVANWSLGSSVDRFNGAGYGYYNECPDGSRWFVYYQRDTGYGFFFDARGHLADWYTIAGGTCTQVVCSAPTLPGGATCSDCAMFANPPPAGSFVIPQGISNGPVPNCEIDENGRWYTPRVAPAN